jgi:hypothetical protein
LDSRLIRVLISCGSLFSPSLGSLFSPSPDGKKYSIGSKGCNPYTSWNGSSWIGHDYPFYQWCNHIPY